MQNNLPNGWGGNSGSNPWGNKPSTGGSPWNKAKKEPFAETPKSAPFSDAPKQETPLKDVPVQEAPVKEAPTPEAPIQEEPTQEAPAKEAPKQEEIGTVAVPSAEVTNSKVEEAPAQEEPRVVAPPIVADTEQKPISTAEQPAKTKKTPKKATPVAVPTTKPSKGKSDDENPKKKGNSTVALLTVLLVIVLAALIAVSYVAVSLYNDGNGDEQSSEEAVSNEQSLENSDICDHSQDTSDNSESVPPATDTDTAKNKAHCFKCGTEYDSVPSTAWVSCTQECGGVFPADINGTYSCYKCGKTDLNCFFIDPTTNDCLYCVYGDPTYDRCLFCETDGHYVYIHSDGACVVCKSAGASYCAGCRTALTVEERSKYDGYHCHRCLTCCCGKAISAAEYLYTGGSCYENYLFCTWCGKRMSITEREQTGSNICSDCYLRCYSCEKAISTEDAEKTGGGICCECFFECFFCGKTISETEYEEIGRCCRDCLKCRYCNEIISGEYIDQGYYSYVCYDCYYTCNICGKTISEEDAQKTHGHICLECDSKNNKCYQCGESISYDEINNNGCWMCYACYYCFKYGEIPNVSCPNCDYCYYIPNPDAEEHSCTNCGHHW